MHHIEPFFLWQNLYQSQHDSLSPFYGREYSEIYFSHKIYNYVIHPQWDSFGSETLFIKVLFTDYDERYVVIEMIGEWNDCIYNDIMTFKRDFIDELLIEGINKFILIGENVLNFHGSDDSYYEEWCEDTEGGWVALLNFQPYVLAEMKKERLHYYLRFGGELDDMDWRGMKPHDLFEKVEACIEGKLLPE